MARFTKCLSLLVPCALLVVGCTSPGTAEGKRPGASQLDPDGLRARRLAPKPFPAAFQKEAILVADRISIEGPKDLLEHIALRTDSESFEHSMKTTERGLLQSLRRKPDVEGVDVRCQLDGWQIAALEQLVILQRPGEVAITIIADGNAAYLPTDGTPERREPRLTFQYQR